MTAIPKPPIKPKDYHLVLDATHDDQALEPVKAKLFSAEGKLLLPPWLRYRTLPPGRNEFSFLALAQGVNGPSWDIPGGDTARGLYRVGYVRKTLAYESAGIWHSFGEWTLDLEGVPGLSSPEEDVQRAGFAIHGGTSNLPLRYADRLLPLAQRTGCLAPEQDLFATHGCVRAHNIITEWLAHLPCFRWTTESMAYPLDGHLYVTVMQ